MFPIHSNRRHGYYRAVLSGIYQQFYTEKSSSDKGSLYHLRNLINRRNVTGPEDVTSNFRSHQQFVDDVTDAYIVGTFLDNMNMEALSSVPKDLPPFSLLSNEQIANWLLKQVEVVMDCLQLNNFSSLNFLHDEISKLDKDESVLNSMMSETGYACAICGKTYSRAAWFKKHLQKKHAFVFSDSETCKLKVNPLHSFLQMSLLLRDTIDSYKMGDGDRIVRNAYFEWLYASSLHHTKYTVLLWRMIAYVDAVLSPAESAEYKWNMTVNLKGGIQNNIPNDNCVELQVGNIKRQLNTQGSNRSFQSSCGGYYRKFTKNC